MNSKKYIFYFIKIAFVLYIFLYILLGNKIFFMNKEYPMWKYNWDNINNSHQSTYETIIIGDSKAKAGIEPRYFEENTLNLSLGGATPITGYYTLINYLKYNEKPTKIVLSYSPLHLMIQDTFWDRSIYFNYLNIFEVISVFVTDFRLNYKSNFFNNITKLFIYKLNIFKDMKYLNFFLNNENYLKNLNVYNYLVKNHGHHYFGIKNGTDELIEETRIKQFKRNILLNHYLDLIIDLCFEYNIKLYFINLPYNKASYNILNNEYIMGYKNYINSKNLVILNNPYFMNNEMFGDPAHLYQGSGKFTIDLINKLGVIHDNTK
jgi:hypothetical protein